MPPVGRLAIHTVVGIRLFAFIGPAAVLLHHAIAFVEYNGLSPPILKTFHAVELLLFSTGPLAFAPFTRLETYHCLRSIFRA